MMTGKYVCKECFTNTRYKYGVEVNLKCYKTWYANHKYSCLLIRTTPNIYKTQTCLPFCIHLSKKNALNGYTYNTIYDLFISLILLTTTHTTPSLLNVKIIV